MDHQNRLASLLRDIRQHNTAETCQLLRDIADELETGFAESEQCPDESMAMEFNSMWEDR